MQQRRFFHPLAVAAGLALAAFLAACGQDISLTPTADGATQAPATLREKVREIQGLDAPVDVPVIELRRTTIKETLSITGELAPRQSAMVKPMMEGRLTFLRRIEVGTMVEEGETLAKIDDRDIEADIENQRKQVEISREKIELDRRDLLQKEKSFEFDKKLKARNFITQIEFDRSELAVQQAQINLRQSQIMLEQEEKKLEKLLRQREKVPIVAPISGMVVLASHLREQSTQSDLLNEEIMRLEDTLVGPSTELFGIISHDHFEARCMVNGRDKARLTPGQEVQARVIAHREITVPGRIRTVSRVQDQQSHAYKVWIELDEMDPAFTSGLFVRADVVLDQHEQALVVERDYLKERDGRPIVQIVRQGTVADMPVQLGLRNDKTVELLSGVNEGDLLIASRDLYVPGQYVTPVELLARENPATDDEMTTLPAASAW